MALMPHTGSETPEELQQDQPRGPLAAHRMEIKCEPEGGESAVY